jgi:hypothetical protein
MKTIPEITSSISSSVKSHHQWKYFLEELYIEDKPNNIHFLLSLWFP